MASSNKDRSCGMDHSIDRLQNIITASIKSHPLPNTGSFSKAKAGNEFLGIARRAEEIIRNNHRLNDARGGTGGNALVASAGVHQKRVPASSMPLPSGSKAASSFARSAVRLSGASSEDCSHYWRAANRVTSRHRRFLSLGR